MRPRGLSPLPVRPLRLRPITATAGGRPTVTPGTGPHQLAAVTLTGRGPAELAPPVGAIALGRESFTFRSQSRSSLSPALAIVLAVRNPSRARLTVALSAAFD